MIALCLPRILLFSEDGLSSSVKKIVCNTHLAVRSSSISDQSSPDFSDAGSTSPFSIAKKIMCLVVGLLSPGACRWRRLGVCHKKFFLSSKTSPNTMSHYVPVANLD
jgi:hypothetical protein